MTEEMTIDRAREVVATTGWREAAWRTVERLRTAGRVLAAKVDQLLAKVALLEHQADCAICEITTGDWAREHCTECDRLNQELEAAAIAGEEEKSDE